MEIKERRGMDNNRGTRRKYVKSVWEKKGLEEGKKV